MKQPYYPNAKTERNIIFAIIVIMFIAGYCMGQAGEVRERRERIEAAR